MTWNQLYLIIMAGSAIIGFLLEGKREKILSNTLLVIAMILLIAYFFLFTTNGPYWGIISQRIF